MPKGYNMKFPPLPINYLVKGIHKHLDQLPDQNGKKELLTTGFYIVEYSKYLDHNAHQHCYGNCVKKDEYFAEAIDTYLKELSAPVDDEPLPF